MAKKKKSSPTKSDESAAASAKADAKSADKANLASAKKNSARMQPGVVETTSSGQRVIHPAANPQQVNPLHDAEHEKAAVKAAEVLTDKKATPQEKTEAAMESNRAEGAPGALAQEAHEQAVKDDQAKRAEVDQREADRAKAAKKAANDRLSA